jgi:hypothetical protein
MDLKSFLNFQITLYTFFKRNSSLETMRLLAKECAKHRLFWASEHTSNGASVHTAFATGQREAQKILKHHSNRTHIIDIIEVMSNASRNY